jgi:hypothetical protein
MPGAYSIPVLKMRPRSIRWILYWKRRYQTTRNAAGDRKILGASCKKARIAPEIKGSRGRRFKRSGNKMGELQVETRRWALTIAELKVKDMLGMRFQLARKQATIG